MYDIPGTRFTLLGDWDDTPEPADRVVLRLHPDNGATYSPTNPSTATMLAAMEQADLAGKTVLDFGTGSGVLAVAALALGAAHVHAIDHNPAALTAAVDTIMANPHDARMPSWSSGDPGERYDVILANVGDGDLISTLVDRCDLLIASCPKARKKVSGGRGTKPVYTPTIKDIKQRLIERGRPQRIVDFDPEWAVVVG